MIVLCIAMLMVEYAPWLLWAIPLLFIAISILNACRAEKQRREEEAARQAREAERARKAWEAAAAKEEKEKERRQKAAEKARKAAERRRIAEERRQKREAEKARKAAEAQAAKSAQTQRARAIPEIARPSGAQPFAGEIVAFTGKCPKMDHRHMIEHVNRLGGRGYDDVYVRTTLLVVGEKPGKGKLDKAVRYNIPTITWEEWWERAFGFPAVAKPEAETQSEKEEESILTLEQFAAIAEHAA